MELLPSLIKNQLVEVIFLKWSVDLPPLNCFLFSHTFLKKLSSTLIALGISLDFHMWPFCSHFAVGSSTLFQNSKGVHR